MVFSLLFTFVSFLALPCCGLAGHSLLGNAAAASSSTSPSATIVHKPAFGRHSSVPMMRNNGIVPMRKFSSSKSFKISAKLDGERKNAFLTKPIKSMTDEEAEVPTVFHEQIGEENDQDNQTDNYVLFPIYWHAVLNHFDGKVPAKIIANILCRLIAALKLCKGNHDYDVITSKIDFDGILTAQHFLTKPIFRETEIRGNITFIVKKIDVPTNLSLAYMSPEQVMHNSFDHSTEEDIVWSLGVMLFTMLINRHPLQGMANEHFNLAQQNANNKNNRTVDIVRFLANSSEEDMVPKWRKMISFYVRSEQELPLEYLKLSIGDGNDHALLIPVIERCLQMQKQQRISLCRLRKTLEEIVEEIENAN
ncbi:hypothetical protein niasHT_029082 [Heterodera trifolii]|uniref:Protein kinase domain-containing protein n=1 Tax=Heterodera trifolii TaxID=157864 RepID=A0ABD2KS07_9BILA